MPHAQNPPRNHHRLPRWYLRGFGDDHNRVTVVSRDGGRRDVAVKWASVGRDFYTVDDGNGDSQMVEEAIGPIESVGARIARAMTSGSFPPSDSDKLEFAGFLALQTVRGPDFRARWNEVLDSEGVAAHRNFTMGVALNNMPRLANAYLRVLWRLCRFTEPSLITGDQPVAFWRRGETPSFFTGIGPLAAQEVRFPLDPRHALVLTWAGGREDERLYELGTDVAGRLNDHMARWCRHELYCSAGLQHLVSDPLPPPLPDSTDPRDADAVVAYLTQFPNWREAEAVVDGSDWGRGGGYGIEHPRRL